MLKEILKDAQGVPTGNYKDIAGGTLYADSPIGSIVPYGGATAPSGWLICDGASLLRTDYAELFAVIGTAFGSADSTHFNIPDMRESVPKGAGLTSKSSNHMDADGLAVGEFLDDRVQDHQHKLGSNDGTVDGYWATNQDGSSLASSDLRVGGSTADNPRIYAKDIISGRTGATTEVKSVGVNYIIKAKMVAMPADLASGVEEFLKPVSGTVSLSSSITGAQSYLKKSGKVVSLFIQGQIDTPLAGTDGLIATLPEGFRPKNAFYQAFTAIYGDDQYPRPFTVMVDIDGTIKTSTGGGIFKNDQVFCINMTYMLD